MRFGGSAYDSSNLLNNDQHQKLAPSCPEVRFWSTSRIRSVFGLPVRVSQGHYPPQVVKGETQVWLGAGPPALAVPPDTKAS